MILHTKGAEEEILKYLKQYKLSRIIIHWYSGSIDILNELIKLGIYFSIGVDILFSDQIKKISKLIPLNQLLLETDNPGAYKWLSKKIGMPSIINRVAYELSMVRNTTKQNIIEQTNINFKALIQNDEMLIELNNLISV